MQLAKFEEKVAKLIEESGCYIPIEEGNTGFEPQPDPANENKVKFGVEVQSFYKRKYLEFTLFGVNDINFKIQKTTLDELFDAAYGILKAFVQNYKKESIGE